jgi:hypothetical protein
VVVAVELLVSLTAVVAVVLADTLQIQHFYPQALPIR